MTAGIGHNNGPTLEPGFAWRKHVWTRARRNLFPTLPIEVVRLRVKRAKELGLPYRTYAGLRAATGHDLVGFMFSNNALGVLRSGQGIAPDRAVKLAGLVSARRIALIAKTVQLQTLAADIPLDAQYAAPDPHASWSDLRDHLKSVVHATGQPADRFVIVGDAPWEHDWLGAMQAAGYLTGQQYFSSET